MIPKIIFKPASLDYNIQLMKYFLFCDSYNLRKKILKVYPELEKVYSIKNKGKKRKFIETFVKNVYSKNINIVKKKKETVQKSWNKINNLFMDTLSKILETKWPSKKKRIIGFVSVVPICPRHLKTWTFSLYFKDKTRNVMYLIAHETSHFLYFKKFKEIFPKINEKRYEVPYIEWYLSEMLAPIILKHPNIKKIIKPTIQKGYHLRKKEKIVLRKLNLLYKKSLENKESFSEFLVKAYKLIRKLNKNSLIVKGFP